MALQEEFNKQGDYLFRNRSYLPLLILIAGLWVYVQGEINETEKIERGFMQRFEYYCLAVSILGLLIRAFTVGYTPMATSGRNTKEGQVAAQLNTTGMYAMTRHPLYLGNFFMWLGLALLTENFWFIIAFVLFFAIYYERIMYREETFLRAKFGWSYLEWAGKTPAFIPNPLKYKKPSQTFNWRKVLINEKTGIVVLFVVFWFFNFVGRWAESGKIYFEINFWFYLALFGGIYYGLIKVLKNSRILKKQEN